MNTHCTIDFTIISKFYSILVFSFLTETLATYICLSPCFIWFVQFMLRFLINCFFCHHFFFFEIITSLCVFVFFFLFLFLLVFFSFIALAENKPKKNPDELNEKLNNVEIIVETEINIYMIQIKIIYIFRFLQHYAVAVFSFI